MIITIDRGNYYEIYSDSSKKIKENDILWNTTKEEPIAVDKTRFANGEYAESDRDIENYKEIDEVIEEIEEDIDENIEIEED